MGPSSDLPIVILLLTMLLASLFSLVSAVDRIGKVLFHIALQQKPSYANLPDSWTLVEVDDQILVLDANGHESLQEVAEIHDNGCVTLRAPTPA